MALMRWDPFRELENISTRLNQIFTPALGPKMGEQNGGLFADWEPALDVEESDKEYLIKADLPEVKKDDVKISVENGTLSLEGERRQEKEEKNKRFHRVERSYGRFVRHLTLPSDVEQQKISAEFKEGVLNVHLPKSPAAKPRSIDVRVS